MVRATLGGVGSKPRAPCGVSTGLQIWQDEQTLYWGWGLSDDILLERRAAGNRPEKERHLAHHSCYCSALARSLHSTSIISAYLLVSVPH